MLDYEKSLVGGGRRGEAGASSLSLQVGPSHFVVLPSDQGQVTFAPRPQTMEAWLPVCDSVNSFLFSYLGFKQW